MPTVMQFLIEGAPPEWPSLQLVCPHVDRAPRHSPPISAAPVKRTAAPSQHLSMQHQLAASALPRRNRASPEGTCRSHHGELPHEAAFPFPRNHRESKHQAPVYTLPAAQAWSSFLV